MAPMGLMAPVAAITETPPQEKTTDPTLPTFKPRWWHRHDRLDIRPVIWSLKNRPQDWTSTDYRLIHQPSNHQFWIASGSGYFRLEDANCSCKSSSRGKFQPLQQGSFGRALKYWRKYHMTPAVDQKQFASHFVR